MFLNTLNLTIAGVDMSFLKLPTGVENIVLSNAGTGKTKLGIFDSSKVKVLADLDTGIREAQGRYVLTDENTQGAASADNPVKSARLKKEMNRPYASTCWAPQMVMVDPKDRTKGYKPKVDPTTGQELVRVYIKCKGAKVDKILADMGGNPQLELQISATDLVPTLQAYRDALADMEKDSELGKYWHDNAVHNSFPPKERKDQASIDAMGHCMESDTWKKKADVVSASPYPTQAIKAKA